MKKIFLITLMSLLFAVTPFVLAGYSPYGPEQQVNQSQPIYNNSPSRDAISSMTDSEFIGVVIGVGTLLLGVAGLYLKYRKRG